MPSLVLGAAVVIVATVLILRSDVGAPPVVRGTMAPEFSLPRLDPTDPPIELSALSGRVVLINFWATWCRPCVVEHPVLVDGARRYQGRAQFLGIIYQDEVEKIKQFMAARGGWGSTLVDPNSKVALAYGVYGAPETFILDRHGRIVEKVTGAMSPSHLDALLGPLL